MLLTHPILDQGWLGSIQTFLDSALVVPAPVYGSHVAYTSWLDIRTDEVEFIRLNTLILCQSELLVECQDVMIT